jgi:hypothetical protein
MANVSKIFAKGTIIAITAKAEIPASDANLLQYSWRKNGAVVTSVLTSGTATLITSTPGSYDVVVSHPNADTITSNSFNLFYREPEDIIRLIYQTGDFSNIDSNSGNFTSFQVIDWNIAEKEFEMGPGVGDAARFGNPAGGWWRVFAKERDLSLDVTLRGSCGGEVSNSRISGQGGEGTLRRTFETNQLYSFRIGDRRTGATDDVQLNGPNGGRIFSGSGEFGGGQTYMKRGGTLVAVCGGGGGSATNADGGAGGGLNVPGESGQGNGRSGGSVFNPGTQISYSGYPRNFGVRAMTRCGQDARTGGMLCTFENSAVDVQNNGGFGDNNGGGGGSGLQGGSGGRSSNEGGCGGSGWASSAVTVLSASLGGGGQDQNGSVRIRQTGFNNYIVQWYHITGVRQGLIPTFNLTNNGNFTATVTPQNVGFETNQGPESSKHYLVEFEEPFSNTLYNITFTFIGDLTAAGTLVPSFNPIIFDKQVGSFRVKFADADGTPHIREAIFKVEPA